ncbi:MAG TPA: caspase family protein [Sedimentisphaerales bacterium]|nr:caspase family protein [Sedimentisphaerales bacterium]
MPIAEKRYAVIVGVSKYEPGETISELPFANNDALRLYRILVAQAGFHPHQVYLLVEDAPDLEGPVMARPTRPNILNKLEYVLGAAGDNDIVLFFFAGHGLEISQRPYLITADTRMNVLSETALDIGKLNEWCEASKARCVVRLFDACRAPFGGARGTDERMTEGFQDAILKTAAGWATFSACSTGEVAHEFGEFEQGVFSYFLCEALEGKAANDEGVVSFERLVDYVKTSVGNWCDRQTIRQTPNMKADLSGTLTLTTVQKPAKKTPPPQDEPLAKLYTGLDALLSNTPSDLRNLAFTTDQQMRDATTLLESEVHSLIKDSSYPGISISASAPLPLSIVTLRSYRNLFDNEISQRGVRDQLTATPSTLLLSFKAPEVVIADSEVCLVVARFSFFYWLWYVHSYQPSQDLPGFKPDPPFATGFFTFKPTALQDRIKVSRAVKELFNRSSDTILNWSEQLRKYADSRIAGLRDMGPIIE